MNYASGYFPGVALRPEAPRLLLVGAVPRLSSDHGDHLSYFSPSIDVERIGLGIHLWRGFYVMFRLRGPSGPTESIHRASKLRAFTRICS